MDTSGEFWVEAINEGCVTRDTSEVTVNPIPVLELGDSQVLCEGDFLTLDVTTSGATYEWQDGSSNSTYDVLDPGMYSVVVDLDGVFQCGAGFSLHRRAILFYFGQGGLVGIDSKCTLVGGVEDSDVMLAPVPCSDDGHVEQIGHWCLGAWSLRVGGR